MVLVGGIDGMDIVCCILVDVLCYLKLYGVLVVEIGNECENVEVVFFDFDLVWLLISVGED